MCHYKMIPRLFIVSLIWVKKIPRSIIRNGAVLLPMTTHIVLLKTRSINLSRMVGMPIHPLWSNKIFFCSILLPSGYPKHWIVTVANYTCSLDWLHFISHCQRQNYCVRDRKIFNIMQGVGLCLEKNRAVPSNQCQLTTTLDLLHGNCIT